MKPWIGVDLDGTLAKYGSQYSRTVIGPPIIPMIARVKMWLRIGKTVKIFTARVTDHDPKVIAAIKQWCKTWIGEELEVTNVKDFLMEELWDDKAIGVIRNTGERADGKKG